MYIITGSGAGFSYKKGQIILKDTSFAIESGKTTAIIGRNGCGKSTLIKLIAALYPLSEGKILLDNIDITGTEGKQAVRERCGIVFQNPDNQFVAPIIEDDIRFGLENHHIPPNEYPKRIESSLQQVNLSGFEKRSISTLSGGQKQRAAMAAMIALDNDICIFDEATSMLDPDGREEIHRSITELRKTGKTIIIVTQNIQDVILADYVMVLADNHIIKAGSPKEILTDRDLLAISGIQIPYAVEIYYELQKNGIQLPFCPLTIEELAGEICSLN